MARQEKTKACVDVICQEEKTMQVSSIWVFLCAQQSDGKDHA